MSWQALTWACEQTCKATDKLVLIMLANRVNHDTGRCTPAIDRLAAECGLSRSGVKTALKRLQDAGLVEVIQRSSEGVNLSNQYRLSINGKLTGRSPDDRPPGRDVTTNQESKPGSSNTGAKLDFSTWPKEPSPQLMDGWLKLRKHKRAPVTDVVMVAMGKALHQAAAIGWDVDAVLEECCNRGWQGFRVEWLESRNGKPQPVRAGAGTASPPHGRNDYARSGQGGNNGARGGAIDRVLGNAYNRAESAAPADGFGPDRGDDDGGLWS